MPLDRLILFLANPSQIPSQISFAVSASLAGDRFISQKALRRKRKTKEEFKDPSQLFVLV